MFVAPGGGADQIHAYRVEAVRRQLPFEFLMNVLRLNDGCSSALFTQRTGLPLSVLSSARGEAEARGLLLRDPSRLAASREGQLFLNDLLQHFLA